MDTQDEIRRYNEQLNRLKAELSCPRLSGPRIVHGATPSQVMPHFRFTGSYVFLSNRRLKMQAAIFTHDKWLFPQPLSDLYLAPSQIPFSFTSTPWDAPLLDGRPLVSLQHVIRQLYGLARSPAPLPEFLLGLDPLIAPTSASSPLHTNCLDFVSPDLAADGFAVARIFAKGTMLRVRFAWIFPKDRDVRPVVNYLTAGTLRLRTDSGNVFGEAEWLPEHGHGLCPLLQQWLSDWAGKDPARLFSEVGRYRVEDKLFWAHGVKSPRRAAHEKRVAFVREHPELWNDEEALAQALRHSGLYSPKTNRWSIQWACRTLIEKAQNATPPPDGGDAETPASAPCQGPLRGHFRSLPASGATPGDPANAGKPQ